MAILIFCKKCKLYYSQKNYTCPKCETDLTKSKKFRINVSSGNNQRITKTVEGNLTLARKVEAKIKHKFGHILGFTISGILLLLILPVVEAWIFIRCRSSLIIKILR